MITIIIVVAVVEIIPKNWSYGLGKLSCNHRCGCPKPDSMFMRVNVCVIAYVHVCAEARIQTSGIFYSSPFWFLKYDHLLTMVLTDWLDSPFIHSWNLLGKNTTEYLTTTCIHTYAHTHKHRGKNTTEFLTTTCIHTYTLTLKHRGKNTSEFLITACIHTYTHTLQHRGESATELLTTASIHTYTCTHKHRTRKIQLNSGALLKRSLILRWMWPIPGR